MWAHFMLARVWACSLDIYALSLSLSPSLSLSLPLSLSLTCEDGVCGRAFFMLARVRTQMSIEICGERKREGKRERE